MIIRIRNGKNTTYDYRRELFEDGFKLERKAYGKSYFELHVEDDNMVNQIKGKYGALHLNVEIVPDSLVRNNKYRDMYFKTYPAEEYRCVYCGKILSKVETTIDHIYPVDKANTIADKKYIEKNGLSGINDIMNLVPSCRKCNSKKHTKTGLWILRAKVGKLDAFLERCLFLQRRSCSFTHTFSGIFDS